MGVAEELNPGIETTLPPTYELSATARNTYELGCVDLDIDAGSRVRAAAAAAMATTATATHPGGRSRERPRLALRNRQD